MGYNDGIQLNDTGHETMVDRVKAFRKLIYNLSEFAAEDNASEAALDFINDWWSRFENMEDLPLDNITVTPKQYFWAKDLYDKVNNI